MTNESFTENAITDKLVSFFRTTKEGKYLEKIDGLAGSHLQINYMDVFDYQTEPVLFELLNKDPRTFVECCKTAIKGLFTERYGAERSRSLNPSIMIDKSDFEISVADALKGKHLHRLVTVPARINGEGTMDVRIIKGVWYCVNGHKTTIYSDEKPTKCENERCTERKLECNYEESEIENFRPLYLKSISFTGHHGDTLVAEVTRDLDDLPRTGDVVDITGYILPHKKDKKLFLILHILGISVRHKIDYEISDADKKRFEQWPKEVGFYEKVVNSIAPDVYGNQMVKEAFLLAYVGSPQWRENQRYWINVLPVGDPATAKSKIAEWGNAKLPNVALVSSKAGSAKGLFAGQKEEVDGKKILEIGPMVQCSDIGLVCIDEFARMSEVFDIFYTPMETGRFNSATVGGHAELACKTPIYATGNPKKSNKWDETKSLIDNLVVFEPSMLSRFDIIPICKDEDNFLTDKKIARTILGHSELSERPDAFPEENFIKYLLYAKTFNPKLTPEVDDQITEVYADVRKQARGMMIEHQDITARIVGTITRITLGIARLHLRREATLEDVIMAKRLLDNMFSQRGLRMSNTNTYIERVGQKVLTILEASITPLVDGQIYEKIMETFTDEKDSLINDIGGPPNRRENKKWRAIMENVQKSYLVEIVNKMPITLRYKHEQRIL